MKSILKCSIGTFAVLLAACAGQTVTLPMHGSGGAQTKQQEFKYTGKEQSFVVPAHVTSIAVDLLGAMGGGSAGGRGGRVTAAISVKPGETLVVFVGGEGSELHPGFNGGAAGASGTGCKCPGYGGGGASDVRSGGDKLSDRILDAAGGAGQGGANSSGLGEGGGGGGLTGGTGGGGPYNYQNGGGGFGGTQSAGGGAGSAGASCDKFTGKPGAHGTLGAGGAGGAGAKWNGHSAGGGGGGGGGGYYGGGGAGGGCGGYTHYINGGGGGGGGSSYIEHDAKNKHMWSAWKAAKGDGVVVFDWR